MFDSISVQTSTSDNYSIAIGQGLLQEITEFIGERFGTRKIFLIIDQNVHDHHISRIEEHFSQAFGRVLKYIVPPGERSKNLTQYSRIMDFILKEGVERGSPVVAIGGGVVGDLAGFVTASVLRGLPLIHVPTTLLAMVDSSIGGKTGVNHETGKNLIGAFYQPKAVFMDVDFLSTLPEKEWVNGLSEILKYGMIEKPELLGQLKELTNGGSFAAPVEWLEVIKQSAGIKVDIVQRDVKEGGVRAFLNFGHTYAHVIERMGNYEGYSHGEAVFAGMFGAIEASNKLGASIDEELLETFKPLYGFTLSKINEHPKELTEWMLNDKKVKDGSIRLVLLEEIAKPIVKKVDDLPLIENSWQYLLKKFN